MKALAYTIVALYFFCAGDAFAQERFAQPGDGFRLNQKFFPLEDGTFYATHDKKIVDAEKVLLPEKAEEEKRQALDRLDRLRYWHSGSPPETTALERYFIKQEKLKANRELLESLQSESWMREGFVGEPGQPEGPPDQGG